jgi:hypothetical protein
MRRIFISYRRSDTADQAGRIYDRLVREFSRAGIFKDVDSVPAGADFRVAIEQAMRKSDVVIAILGPSWSSAVDDDGHRRLDNENDFVRFELEKAVKLDKLIIPVLVGSAKMPQPAHLPATLEALAFKHAMTVRPDPDFHRDLDRLIRAIKVGGATHKAQDRASQPGAHRRLRTAAAAIVGMVVVAILGLVAYIELRPHIDGPGPNEQSGKTRHEGTAPRSGPGEHPSNVPPANLGQGPDVEIGPTKRRSDSISGIAAEGLISWRLIETRTEGGKKLKIGIITLFGFYGRARAAARGVPDALSATIDSRKTLSTFRAHGVDAVLIDLRANNIGLLDEAITFSGLFIDTGPVLQIKAGPTVKHLDDEDKGTSWDGPLVVLIDGNTGGPAEVFAGVIKDYQRGLLVGDSRTAGVDLSESPLLLAPFTRGEFYRPDGARILTDGVAADIVVSSRPPVVTYKAPKNSNPRIAGLPHDNYNRVPADLVAKLRDRSAARRAGAPPLEPADIPTNAWENNPYNDEIIRITVDYFTLGSRVLAAAPEPAPVAGQ